MIEPKPTPQQMSVTPIVTPRHRQQSVFLCSGFASDSYGPRTKHWIETGERWPSLPPEVEQCAEVLARLEALSERHSTFANPEHVPKEITWDDIRQAHELVDALPAPQVPWDRHYLPIKPVPFE